MRCWSLLWRRPGSTICTDKCRRHRNTQRGLYPIEGKFNLRNAIECDHRHQFADGGAPIRPGVGTRGGCEEGWGPCACPLWGVEQAPRTSTRPPPYTTPLLVPTQEGLF